MSFSYLVLLCGKVFIICDGRTAFVLTESPWEIETMTTCSVGERASLYTTVLNSIPFQVGGFSHWFSCPEPLVHTFSLYRYLVAPQSF